MTTWHYSGSGNAMVIVDMRGDTTPLEASIVRALCQRHPIGLSEAEGLLAIRDVDDTTIIADFYNPDGSTGPMCGNGGRTLVSWYADQIPVAPVMPLRLIVASTEYSARLVEPSVVEILFPPPREHRFYPAGTVEGVVQDLWYVDVGSDHAVLFDPPPTFNAKQVRFHPMFSRGVNVNMAHVNSESTVELATFERGVERVTGACGTGAISTAFIAMMLGMVNNPVTIIPPSGQALIVTAMPPTERGIGLALRGATTYDHAPVEFSLERHQYLT